MIKKDSKLKKKIIYQKKFLKCVESGKKVFDILPN